MDEKKQIKHIKNKPEITSIEVLPGRVVKLSWTDAIGAAKYAIRRVTGEGDDRVNIKLDDISAEFTSYCDTTITDDGEYRYYIVGFKRISPKELVKERSAEKKVSIISVGAPDKPSVEPTKNGLKISWKRNEDAIGYVVLRRFSFMKKGVPLATVNGDATEYVDDSFCEGQLLYYSLQTITKSEDNNLYSNPSNETAGTILPTPHVLKIKKKLFGKIVVNVRLCAGADGYILYKSDSENGEYTEVYRSKSISDMNLFDEKKGGAWYCVACYKNGQKSECYTGKKCKPFYVK